MLAAVFDRQTGAPVCRKVPIPSLKPGEALVKARAASVSAGDVRLLRMGHLPDGKRLGSDIAGTVEAVGAGVRSLRPGDEVAGDLSGCGQGAFAEYAVAPEAVLVKKPASLPFELAAAMPVASVAALQALRACENPGPGKRVLVCGAGGGVGTFAVQLLKHLGAYVAAVCGPGNADLMRALGADRVVDYTREDFAQTCSNFDFVIAVNGSRPLSAYRRVLRRGGTAVIVGGPIKSILFALAFGPLLSLGGKKIRALVSKPDPADLATILNLAAEGKARPVIDRTYPLSEAAGAVRYAAGGHARGKIVLRIAP